MIYGRVIGTGGYVPAQKLLNADLEKMVDTNDEWIMKRVGVRKRHIIGTSAETTISMSKQAALNALAMSNITAQDIDLIIVATATPHSHFPSNACVLHKELEITRDIPAFDLNAACAGFIYALSVADKFFKSGSIKHALIIGVDSLTKLVDWTDRTTCILFGDGAGAVVLSADTEPGIMLTNIHANGHFEHLISSNNTIKDKTACQFIKMRGNEVFKIAVNKLGEIIEKTIAQSGLSKSDINWLIPHQANLRIIQAMAKKLDLPMERVILTIEKHGNTSAASIPLAFDHAVRQGQIKRDEILLFEAFGAGLAWGSALVKY